MNQSNLSKWLKIITAGTAICGLILFFVVIPSRGFSWADAYPEYAYGYLAWQIFFWIAGIPCFFALGYFWRICTEIGKDNSFSEVTAKLLVRISWLAAIDTLFFFVGNIVFAFLSMTPIWVLFLSFIADFVGIAVAVLAAALSHLVYKAAELKAEAELTI